MLASFFIIVDRLLFQRLTQSQRQQADDRTPRITISNPLSSRNGADRKQVRRAANTPGSNAHPLSKNRVWKRSEIEPQIIFPHVLILVLRA